MRKRRAPQIWRYGGGGTVEFDYRIFKEDSKIKVQITDIRR